MALRDRNKDYIPYQKCKGDNCTNWAKFRTKNEHYFDDYSQSYVPYLYEDVWWHDYCPSCDKKYNPDKIAICANCGKLW